LISKAGADHDETVEAGALGRVVEMLDQGRGVSEAALSAEEERLLRGFGFLTAKPLVVVMNVGDDQVASDHDVRWSEWCAARGAGLVSVPGDLLAELGRLSDDDATLFAAEYGIEPDRALVIIEKAWHTLGTVTFYTATGGEELRAWTLGGGGTALDAAGAIHSDFARGFIRAEVIGAEALIGAGSWADARKAGLVRQEGKTYRVADGDVMNIKFAI
jgi:ribosome-binding ATPase YchF (GTP1/OBG family)